MKFKHSLNESDVLELGENDLKALFNGETLKVSGLIIKREEPEVVRCYVYDKKTGDFFLSAHERTSDLKITYDEAAGKILKAEVLK